MVVKRGDMFYADLSPVVGSEQGGIRPVLIIQNDLGNKYSPTVIAAAITSQTGKSKLPTHIEINATENGLKADSVVLAEQIRTIDKSRLKEKIGHIDDDRIISKINDALGVSFGLWIKIYKKIHKKFIKYKFNEILVSVKDYRASSELNCLGL